MGLKVGEVKLEKHNPRWQYMFAKELEELWEYFGDEAIRISHIGSTAVEGLEAKPIIDIAVAVRDLEDFDKVSHKFTSNPEYSIKEDFDNDEILIRKGGKLNRQFYIHVMDIDSVRYKNTIFFRDILLHDKQVLNDYRNLKHILAKKYPHERKKYTSNKADFIETTLDMMRPKTAMPMIAVIAVVSLITTIISLFVRFTIPLDAQHADTFITHLYLSRIGICFGGVIFITMALALIVLGCRYAKAKEHYDKIVAKINKEIAKESKKKQ